MFLYHISVCAGILDFFPNITNTSNTCTCALTLWQILLVELVCEYYSCLRLTCWAFLVSVSDPMGNLVPQCAACLQFSHARLNTKNTTRVYISSCDSLFCQPPLPSFVTFRNVAIPHSLVDSSRAELALLHSGTSQRP